MHWRRSAAATARLEALKSESDPHSRGPKLEGLLSELFGREHFRVTKDLVAGGRQIDLFVIRGRLSLLVEAKWTERPAQHDVLDAMNGRLLEAAPNVVGLVVSMSGFTKEVVKRVERSTGRPILLMDGDEVEHAAAGGGLYTLVQHKFDQLVRNRKVVFGSSGRGVSVWMDEFPEAGLRIVDAKGVQHPWWESESSYTYCVPMLRRPDPALASEGAVRLDLSLELRDAGEVVALMKNLAQLGWLSTEGSWRIEQETVCWTGLGPAEFGRQLTKPEARYRGRQFHQSEQAYFADESEDALLVLATEVSSTSDRLVRWCDLTFILPGIPVDDTPLESLVSELPIVGTPTFRIITEDPAYRSRLKSRAGNRVDPVAFLIREEPYFSTQRDDPTTWVEGIVVEDTAGRATHGARLKQGLPADNLGHLFVALRQHHPLGEAVTHQLQLATRIDVSSVVVSHVFGDWRWPTGP
jgi:hypothetical protein